MIIFLYCSLSHWSHTSQPGVTESIPGTSSKKATSFPDLHVMFAFKQVKNHFIIQISVFFFITIRVQLIAYPTAPTLDNVT